MRGVCPRDELLRGSASRLSDEEVLAVLLGDRVPGKRTRVLLEHNPIPEGLWRASGEDLTRVPGIGPASAARVLAGFELSRRAPLWSLGDRPAISGAEDVAALCSTRMRGLDREHFLALALNTKNRLLRIVEVSVGSLSASIVHPRELFKDAVRLSASAIVVVHNHPSGDPTPSGADIQLTRRLVKAGDVLGIELLDHVVIGDGGTHVSLRESGLM